MNIVSQIKINGKWVNQSDLPDAVAKRIIRKSISKGLENIRCTLNEKTNEKTA